jgi:hypothetical protein
MRSSDENLGVKAPPYLVQHHHLRKTLLLQQLARMIPPRMAVLLMTAQLVQTLLLPMARLLQLALMMLPRMAVLLMTAQLIRTLHEALRYLTLMYQGLILSPRMILRLLSMLGTGLSDATDAKLLGASWLVCSSGSAVVIKSTRLHGGCFLKRVFLV